MLQSLSVSQPLALVLYEKLTPGSQLINRLQDMKYRVHPLGNPADLLSVSSEMKPLVIFADLDMPGTDVLGAVTRLRQNSTTAHIPVILLADEITDELNDKFKSSGATVTATDAAVLTHLPQLLEQALRVE